MNTKTNVDRYSHGIGISGMPDVRTVNPGQAVRYHAAKTDVAAVDPLPPGVADRLIEIIEHAQRTGGLDKAEARRLRMAIERRLAGAR